MQLLGCLRAAALPGKVWHGNVAVVAPPPALLQRSAWASVVQGLRCQPLSTSAEDRAAALLWKAVAPQPVLTNKQIKQAEQVLELIDQGMILSNRQLQKVLDAFFASGAAAGVDSYNLLLWVLSRLDVNKCLKAARKMSESPGVHANRQTFEIVIEACVRTKRLEEAIGFIHQIRIVRPSRRSVSLTCELVKLCKSENNVEAARVCREVLGQLYTQHGAGKNENNPVCWHLRQLDAWLADRENNSGGGGGGGGTAPASPTTEASKDGLKRNALPSRRQQPQRARPAAATACRQSQSAGQRLTH